MELLVVIAILVIVVTIGIPNFGPTVANGRATSAANDLLGALQLARSEAVRLNEPVVISSEGGDWAQGWEIARSGTPIRQRDHQLTRVTIIGPNQLVFSSVGNAVPADSFLIEATGGGNPRRCLTVTASGSAAITRGDCL